MATTRHDYNELDRTDESLNAESITQRAEQPTDEADELEKLGGVPINPLTAPGEFAAKDRTERSG